MPRCVFRVCTLDRRRGRACGDLEKTEVKREGRRKAGRSLRPVEEAELRVGS